jgi:hypothetical protein
MMSGKEERNKDLIYQFNEGRLSADKKWIDAIDRRIAELELQVGIPELRRLKKLTMFHWNNIDDDSEVVNTHTRHHKKVSFRVSKSRVRKNV